MEPVDNPTKVGIDRYASMQISRYLLGVAIVNSATLLPDAFVKTSKKNKAMSGHSPKVSLGHLQLPITI